jgi:hypothetical protein
MFLKRIRVNLAFLYVMGAVVLIGVQAYAAAVGVILGGLLTLGLLARRMAALPSRPRRERNRSAAPTTPAKSAFLVALVSMYVPILGLILIPLGAKLGLQIAETLGALMLAAWIPIPFFVYAVEAQALSPQTVISMDDELIHVTGLSAADGRLVWRQRNGAVRSFDVADGTSAGPRATRVKSISLVGYDAKSVAGGRVGTYLILIVGENGASFGRIPLPATQLGISVFKGFHPTISETVHRDLEQLCDSLGLSFTEETFDDAERLNARHPGAVEMAWLLSHPGKGVTAVSVGGATIALLIIVIVTVLTTHS